MYNGPLRYGVSTYLYHRQRLTRDHLLDIAAHGFETVEVFAARSHFDYHNPAVIADLQQWLGEAGLEVERLAVPPAATGTGGADADEARQALFVGRRISMTSLVVPVGPPREAVRLVEELAELAPPLGITIAVDSRSASMTPIGSLVHFVDTVSERVDARIGICLDFAAAERTGDLAGAIEASAEHLAGVRLPVESAIDWPSALTAVQKVGFEGTLVLEAAAYGAPREALKNAQQARRRMEKLLTM